MTLKRLEYPNLERENELKEFMSIVKEIEKKYGFVVIYDIKDDYISNYLIGDIYLKSDVTIWNFWRGRKGLIAQIRQYMLGSYILEIYKKEDLEFWEKYCNESKYEFVIKVILI